MDAYLAEVLSDSTAIAAIDGFTGRDAADWLFASFSLGVGGVTANPFKPWFAINELPGAPHQEVQETSNARTRVFQIWVYDEEGDFTRINRVLEIVFDIVKAMAPFTFTDESGTVHRCSGSQVSGFSGNLPAPAYDGVCRFLTALFVVSQQ